jgi:hypothetical protein
LLQAQVNLSPFDDVPGLGFAARPAEVLSGKRGVRIRMDRQALTGIQQLNQEASVDAEPFHVCLSQPGFRLLLDRSLQRPAIGKDRDTERLFARERRCRCDPVLRSRSPAPPGSP